MFPRSGAEASGNIDRLSFDDELLARVGKVSPSDDRSEFDFLLLISFGVFPLPVGGDRKGGYFRAGRGFLDFWICGDVSEDADFVD